MENRVVDDIKDIQEKMAHRLELSKNPMCRQCELDAMMYGTALHDTERGHIPFDEAVKIIHYTKTLPEIPEYFGKSVFDMVSGLKKAGDI